MEQLKFKNLMNHLVDVGLHFEPKDLNKLFRVWYSVLKVYSDQELKNAVSNWLLSERNFPTLAELLLDIEKNRLNIGNIRLYLVRKKKEINKRSAEVQEKRKGLHGRDLLNFNEKLKKQSVFPPVIKECIESFGGDIDNILKYNIKEFSLMITQQLHKKIEHETYKLLEK